MASLTGDDETAATVAWRHPDGSPFAEFAVGDEGLHWGLVDVTCDPSSCALELTFTARLEAGEWAGFQVARFYVAPGDQAAPTSWVDSGIAEDGPPEMVDVRPP